LADDFSDPASRTSWRKVLEQLAAESMPPKDQPRPTEADVRAATEGINRRLTAAEIQRRASQGRVVLRRLNRIEYENTVCDLLGVTTSLRDLLPPDMSADGFDNVGDAQHTSLFLLESYLNAAEVALNLAIANAPQPPVTAKRYLLRDQHQVKRTTEQVFRHVDDTVVLFSSSAWQSVSLSEFYPPHRGRYRFRISASGFQSEAKPVTYRVDAGLMLMTGKPHLVGYFDAPADTPSVVEFVDHLEPRNTIRISPYGLASAQAVNKVGADTYDGPGLAIEWVEVEGPLHDVWPPESHRRLFGDLPRTAVPIYNQRDRVEVASENPAADAERILRDFARRAFRRRVTDDDVQPFLQLVTDKLAEGRSFEQAVRAGLAAIMTAPGFLYLHEEPGPLDDFALASRLSYFLWSTTPDQELLTLAEEERLHQPATLRAQVERMLKHPQSRAFTENFVGQWLGLRDIDFTIPSHILYPEFDDLLKVSMVREAELFFAELLQHDLSLLNLVASDFTMLNGRLARHYGIPGVDGWEFRRWPLPPDSHRGGVLTMAGVLKVTANGTQTSPVTRGAWVMDRILGTPPPKPPENIAALEPDTRGSTTIRDQLAKHRQLESCASCHVSIDPPGFALESFDVIGGFRDHYRTSSRGTPVSRDGRKMPYLQGPKVDPADVLADGRRFSDIDELKQLLLTDKDQIARALTVKLVTYATGGAPETIDRPQIDAIVSGVRDKDYGLQSLIHEIVQSDLFRCK